MGNYENVIYLALVLAVVMGAIVLMHILTSTKKTENRPQRVAFYCGAVFIVGVASLVLISVSVNRSAMVDGFKPFTLGDVSAAADLLEGPVAESLESVDDVDVDGFILAFYDGDFLNVEYNAAAGERGRHFQVTGSGTLCPVEEYDSAPGATSVPIELLAGALRSLGANAWHERFGLPESGPVLLTFAGYMAPERMGQMGVETGFALVGGELVPAGELTGEDAARSMPTLGYTSDTAKGCIFLADAI